MGPLDYYRQFEGMSDLEISEELRTRSVERRRLALTKVEPLDLSETTWHEFPHPDVVAAVTYAARRGINRARDPHARDLREALAARAGLPVDRVAAGHGAAALLADAAAVLLAPGDELLTPWPSYPLYPAMARRAGGIPVPVACFDPQALLSAVTPRTRVVVICNPNDPTGDLLGVDALDGLLRALPRHVTVLLDEALRDYVEAEPVDATLALLAAHPRLLVIRTLSKAYGLAGLRCGWAMGGRGSGELLGHLAPPLGLADPIAAGALEALRATAPQVAARRAVIATERRRLLDAIVDLPVDAGPSQANLVWLRAPGLTGNQLASRLSRQAVIVAPGAAVGSDDHVRVTIQSPAATDRLLDALTRGLAEPGQSAAD